MSNVDNNIKLINDFCNNLMLELVELNYKEFENTIISTIVIKLDNTSITHTFNLNSDFIIITSILTKIKKYLYEMEDY